eukprot:TRINITY_DN3983_c0_g2_i3.p2 TRINITY_DN3983_c0_g2~~TRINITY_DN3983_c0_g2_i3.p2  ORF type:complete len:179 (-),score=23.68 TRINITY_DN3983_c0_g2_i3:129-665(-)
MNAISATVVVKETTPALTTLERVSYVEGRDGRSGVAKNAPTKNPHNAKHILNMRTPREGDIMPAKRIRCHVKTNAATQNATTVHHKAKANLAEVSFPNLLSLSCRSIGPRRSQYTFSFARERPSAYSSSFRKKMSAASSSTQSSGCSVAPEKGVQGISVEQTDAASSSPQSIFDEAMA